MDEFLDGNFSEWSIQLPTWPRLLTLAQAAEAIRGQSRLPGACELLVEIGSPLKDFDAGWPLANDLLVYGEVDPREFVRYWNAWGILGTEKRMGRLETFVQLGTSPGQWAQRKNGLALWSSIHLSPSWLRHEASAK